MSRCFPFPPPGCERLLSDKYDDLIESIKRKRQDKERRKQEKLEKKKKEKQLLINQEKSKKNVEMERRHQEEDGFLGENGLTQEHGGQASLPKPSDSSDSTHNTSGNKRKSHISSNLDETHSTTLHRRRRLPPLVELKDPQEPTINTEHPPCSSRGGTEISVVGKMTGNAPCITNIMHSSSISAGTTQVSARDSSKAATDSGPSSRIMQQPFSISGRRIQVASLDSSKIIACHRLSLSCSVSERTEVPSWGSSKAAAAADDDNGPTSGGLIRPCHVSVRTEVPSQDSSKAAATDADVKCKSKSPSDGQSSFRQVIDNWVPPPIQFHPTESEDLDWLFSNRQTKRCKATDVASRNEVLVSNTWPRAQYLPEAAIYALPYTVVL